MKRISYWRTRLCHCGCGGYTTKESNRFIQGHHNRLPKYREQARLKSKEVWSRPGFKEKEKILRSTPEYKAMRSAGSKGFWSKPGFKEEMAVIQAECQEAKSLTMKKHWADPNKRAKWLEGQEKSRQDPEKRAKHKKAVRETAAKPEYRIALSKGQKKRFQNPAEREKQRVIALNNEQIAKTWFKEGQVPWNKDLAKDVDSRLNDIADKLQGRTKETHSYIAIASEKRAKAMRGRTKETDSGVAATVEKLTGRTKETHPYLARAAEKRSLFMREFCNRPEQKERSRKQAEKLWADPNHREKISKRAKEVANDPEEKKRRSERMEIVWMSPRFREKRLETLKNPEYLQKVSGANASNWKGGISAEPYCIIWLDQDYKESIKRRDDYKCMNPNCSGVNKKLCGHHIDYNKKNCRPENIITVCNGCNSKANFHREYWTQFYQQIMQERYGYIYTKAEGF